MRSPLRLTFSASRTHMGRMGALPIFAMNAAPEWISGVLLPLPRRVPSGRMPTSWFPFSMCAARLMAVRSAESRLMGNAPTRERICPAKPWALPNSESRPIRRTNWLGRAAMYMSTTSRNEVWLETTTAPQRSLNARRFSRPSTR